jgi:hypothetical protein
MSRDPSDSTWHFATGMSATDDKNEPLLRLNQTKRLATGMSARDDKNELLLRLNQTKRLDMKTSVEIAGVANCSVRDFNGNLLPFVWMRQSVCNEFENAKLLTREALQKHLQTFIHTHTHMWWYIQVCTMGRRPRVWQALGRDGGWMEGKLRAKFFVTCPDGSDRV